MQIDFLFNNLKPLSLNNSQKITTRGKFAKKYKTDQYKQFESAINLCLRKYKNDLNKFNKHYEKSNYYVVSTYRFYMPITIKDGSRISKTSTDLSNNVKVLEDIIFKQLHADDSEVAVLNVMKIHSKDIRIEVSLELKDLKHIL